MMALLIAYVSAPSYCVLNQKAGLRHSVVSVKRKNGKEGCGWIPYGGPNAHWKGHDDY